MDGVGNSSIYFMNLLKSFFDVILVANYSNIHGVKNFKRIRVRHGKAYETLGYHKNIHDIKGRS